jgi:hypothetical protein
MRHTILTILLVLMVGVVASQTKFRIAAFPHHSVGYILWDRGPRYPSDPSPPTTIPHEINLYNASHGYTGSNTVSMYVDPNGDPTPVPMNNWIDWDNVFARTEWTDGFNSMMANYNVIIVKTGYIAAQSFFDQSGPYGYTDCQQQWRRIIAHMRDDWPNKFFIITTDYPAGTDGVQQRAALADQFSSWCKNTLATGNDSFGPFPKNVHVLDWFHYLVTPGSYCDSKYATSSNDDHPSNAAVGIVDPLFVKEVFDAAIAYENGGPIPVQLNHFFASPQGMVTSLTWSTVSEINNYGFYVQASSDLVSWADMGFVPGHGTTIVPQQYSFVASFSKYYRLKQVDLDGTSHYTESVQLVVGPLTYGLAQNYPNPFNPVTTIQYTLGKSEYAKIAVMNTLGQIVFETQYEFQTAGSHQILFDGSRVASGNYVYTLWTESARISKCMVLLK